MISQKVIEYNSDRNPQVKVKYEALKENPFRFYRGTPQFFYEEISKFIKHHYSPNVFLCGDMHLENFGVFKGQNRLIYFDVNDFDEAIIGPALIDICRLTTSILILNNILNINKRKSISIVRQFLTHFKKSLDDGLIRWVERDISEGQIRTLMDKVSNRRHKKFLRDRVEDNKIKISDKYLKLDLKTKRKIIKSLPHFNILDIAIRLAGTSSLGLDRYIILVDIDDKNHLLDLKESITPCGFKFLDYESLVGVDLYSNFRNNIKNNSMRIIELQKLVQANSPAFLQPIKMDNKWFVLKELQPTEDKINIDSFIIEVCFIN